MPDNTPPYYITEVDKFQDTIYCMHDLMGENDIEPHAHKKGQFLYCEGGLVHVVTQQQTFFLPARHYMWIAPQVTHSIHPGSDGVVMRNLYFPVEPGEPDFFSRTAIYPVNELLLQMILFSNRWNRDLDRANAASYRFALALKAILPEISQFSLPLSLPYARNERLAQVIAYMEENMSEQITFPALARKFGFSERSLSRLFQGDVGMSFIQYLTLQRMMQALKMLLADNMSVKEVAANVGYNSAPTFSTTFLKIVGMRPSDYALTKGGVLRM